MMAFSDGSGPRYACLGGIDALGRVDEQELTHDALGSGLCTSAYAT